MPSECHSKKPPLFLRIPRCCLWYGMDIFWNQPISFMNYHRETNHQHVAKIEKRKKTFITIEP